MLNGPDGALAEIRHHPRLVTRALLALRDAALAGVGVVQLPRMFVDGEFSRGELLNVLPGWEPRRELIHVVYASRRGNCPPCGCSSTIWPRPSRPWKKPE
ncbi:hypothetical protein KP729_004783|nr:hypothetical protein [Delftia acidovorans]